MPLNALRAFEGVAKHGSFTAAANALLISQSALSRHVIALERLVGVQLFDRKPHALSLTKAGQHLLPAVVKSFDRLEYALDDIRNDGAPVQRTLRVQMPPSFAVQLAVPILRDFRGASTEVDIDLISPVRSGAAAGRCRCRGRLLEAHGDGSGGRPVVAGAAERCCAIPTSRRSTRARISRPSSRRMRSSTCGSPICRGTTCGRSSSGRTASPRQIRARAGVRHRRARCAVRVEWPGRRARATLAVRRGDPQGRLVKPFEASLDDGYGYYLITHPEGLGDTAIALFRSWLIERFGTRRQAARPNPAVSIWLFQTSSELS